MTTLEVNSKPVSQLRIKCDLYLGDAVSPLLFCIAVNPLGQIITKSGHRCTPKKGQPSATPPSMDGFKLYAKNKLDIDYLFHLTRI